MSAGRNAACHTHATFCPGARPAFGIQPERTQQRHLPIEETNEPVATRCFGKSVDLEDDALRSHLSRLELQEGIARYLARKIAELTIERRAIEFDKADFRLSETKPFSWRRNLPPRSLHTKKRFH